MRSRECCRPRNHDESKTPPRMPANARERIATTVASYEAQVASIVASYKAASRRKPKRDHSTAGRQTKADAPRAASNAFRFRSPEDRGGPRGPGGPAGAARFASGRRLRRSGRRAGCRCAVGNSFRRACRIQGEQWGLQCSSGSGRAGKMGECTFQEQLKLGLSSSNLTPQRRLIGEPSTCQAEEGWRDLAGTHRSP